MIRTNKTASGTSFYNHTFTATVEDLRNLLGKPEYESNCGDDKTNFDWLMETESGNVFTVYDWKEYRSLREDEVVEWHIGGASDLVTREALLEIREALRLHTL